MVRLFLCLLALLPTLCLAPVPALAEETSLAEEPSEQEPPAPWAAIGTGAAGTCSTDEISEDRACYMVRCELSRGLTFVLQDGFLDDFDPRVVRLEIGAYHEVVRLERSGTNERRVSLAAHPRLLAALISGQDSASMLTVKARSEYSTGFDLTGAKEMIGAVAATCRR